MSQSPDTAAFDELLDAWCDNRIAPEQQAELLRIVSEDSALRQRFVMAMQMQVVAETNPGFAVDGGPDREPIPAVVRRPFRRALQFLTSPTPLSLSVAAIVLGLLVTAMAIVAVPAYRHFAQVNDDSPSQEIVAQLHSASAAVWEEGQIGTRSGSHLAVGRRLRLRSGLVDIRFAAGATLVLEGPSDLSIDGRGQTTLHRGRLTCIVSPAGRGFTIETPTARFVDVGTEFGVHVNPQFGSDLIVFQGAVKAQSLVGSAAKKSVHTVQPGESLRFDRQGAVGPSPMTVDQFARAKQLPFDIRSDLVVLPVDSYAYEELITTDGGNNWPDSLDGGRELINGRLGRVDYRDPEWVGYYNPVDDGKPQPLVVFDLGRPCHLQGLSVVYMHSAGVAAQQAGGSITAPHELQISFSDDGVAFTEPQVFTEFDASPGSARRVARITLPDVRARYAKLDFRQTSPWLFLTEILFYGRPATR